MAGRIQGDQEKRDPCPRVSRGQKTSPYFAALQGTEQSCLGAAGGTLLKSSLGIVSWGESALQHPSDTRHPSDTKRSSSKGKELQIGEEHTAEKG